MKYLVFLINLIQSFHGELPSELLVQDSSAMHLAALVVAIFHVSATESAEKGRFYFASNSG